MPSKKLPQKEQSTNRIFEVIDGKGPERPRPIPPSAGGWVPKPVRDAINNAIDCGVALHVIQRRQNCTFSVIGIAVREGREELHARLRRAEANVSALNATNNFLLKKAA